MSDLAKKMKLAEGARAALVNAPDDYHDLEPLPSGVELHKSLDGDFDWIQIFAYGRDDLERLAPVAVEALRPESMLWISFPKGSSKLQSDLTRDKGWDAMKDVDLRWLNLVSVNDTWSAFSLRPYRAGEERIRPFWDR